MYNLIFTPQSKTAIRSVTNACQKSYFEKLIGVLDRLRSSPSSIPARPIPSKRFEKVFGMAIPNTTTYVLCFAVDEDNKTILIIDLVTFPLFLLAQFRETLDDIMAGGIQTLFDELRKSWPEE